MRWELLDRYLSDSCDSEERNEVDNWLAESAAHQRVLGKIAEALEQTPPEVLRTVRSRLEEELGLELESRESSYSPVTTPKKRAKKSPASAVRAPGEGRAKQPSGRTKPPARESGKPYNAAKQPSNRKRKKATRRKKRT